MSNIFEKFYLTVHNDPQKVALVMDEAMLSFAGTAEKAEAVAAALTKQKIVPGDIVPVVMPRGTEAVCAILGVLMAGAGFCVIDEAYPQERKEFIIKDTAAKLVITPEWMRAFAVDNSSYSPVDPVSEAPAMVVYTSGSTGDPKGVVISCDGFSTALDANMALRSDESCFVSTASFSFVALILDVLAPVFLGATLHIASDEMRKDVELLGEYIKSQGITTAFIQPLMIKPFLTEYDGALNTIVTGSEKVQGIYSSNTRIINAYGTSETCGPFSFFEIDKSYPAGTPIGRCYPEGNMILINGEGKIAGKGETGEICAAGQLAKYYQNLPELTAEAFVNIPVDSDGTVKRVCRTNDIGRVDKDGLVYFVQRKDWMLKVRGFRVEPGEIERAIVKYANASQAVVKGYENAHGQTLLYAVYTADSPLSPDTVRSAIKEYLPDYMLPVIMEQIPEMPVNINGKLDRKSIKPPDMAAHRADYAAPVTDREKQICRAFEAVLDVKDIGIDDDFNLLGGDSISAIRVQSILGGGLSANDILSKATPRMIARTREIRIMKAKERGSWPLTSAEEQMAAEQQMDPESIAYNVNLAFHITGELDIARLESALHSLTMRHQALRSCYVMEKDVVVRKIMKSCEIHLMREKCDLDQVADSIAAGNVPFKLDKAPLARYTLYETGQSFVLHLSFHHIIIDKASGDIFMNELWRLYGGETLEDLKLEYTDYAVWEADNRDHSKDEAFFAEVFHDGIPQNDMPALSVRPVELPPADKDIVKESCIDDIENAAKTQGVSTFAFLTAAVGLTLGKYCSSEDVVVGTAMNGRSLADQSGLFGMLVNTLPVRIRPNADMTVSEYLLETAKMIESVKAHQNYPFSEFTSHFVSERSTGRAPAFDVMVNYLADNVDATPCGLKVEELPIKRQAMNIDLQLEFLRYGKTLRTVLSYSDKVYFDQVAEHFMEQLLYVIDNMIADPKQTLQGAAQLPPAQIRQILEDFEGERVKYRDSTVVEGFCRQAKETPDNRAIVFKEKSFTYEQLDRLTDNVAAYLTDTCSVRPGECVAIMVTRSELMPVSIMSVLKTGGYYMPLDSGYPKERLDYMLKDSDAKILIADKKLRELYSDFEGMVVFTDDMQKLPDTEKKHSMPGPDDLMVLLYTSGTTGNPKGVMLYHKGVHNYCARYADAMKMIPGESVAAYANMGFDAHMLDLYPAMMKGVCLHIIPEELRLDLPKMYEYYANNKVAAMFMTTQMGRQFVDGMYESGYDFSALHSIAVGGEALVPVDPPAGIEMWNLYGPSECSIGSSNFLIDKLYDRIPIGFTTSNSAAYVLDKKGDLAPVGVAGELHISGIQVGKGYLNRPDLTKEKFLKNPFTDDPKYAVMYNSGDVVRFLPDGNIDFVGRSDFQVKIRGFRVELTEIEARIREYPGILDATVQAVADASGGKRVVAYFVSDQVVDMKAVGEFITITLPKYMVPSSMMQVDRIPLTPNGKVNRKALPEIVFQAEEIVPPRTELERVLTDLMQDMLGMEIGITTDLMYAGLSSLSAIKASARITKAVGRELTTRQLMNEKTIENIASILEAKATVEKKSFEKLEVYPLTANQMGIYYAWAKNPAALEYSIPFYLELDSDVDAQRLAKCVESVIEAHPYVKTHLTLKENVPCQIRRDDAPFEVPVIRCTQEEFLKVKAVFARPFEVIGGDLVRIKIYATGDNTYLLGDFHHIIFDGASLDAFLSDLDRVWRGEPLEKEDYSCFDLALLEKDDSHKALLSKAKLYFDKLIGDFEGATVISGGTESGRLVKVDSTVSRSAVEPVLKGRGITQANWFLSAASLVLSRIAGVSQVRIASIINGREGADRQNLFGMLVKTLPVAVDVAGDITAGEYCLATQNRMYEIIDNQEFAYLEASTEYNYNAQVFFAYQGGVIQEHRIGDHPVKIEELGIDTLKFPMSIRIFEEGSNYRVEVEGDEGRFPFMQSLADCIANMAKILAHVPNASLKDISVVTPKQRQVIDSFSNEILPSDIQALHHMFENQARILPEKKALIAGDGEYSYSQLNEKANRLAHTLIEKGICAEDRVAFMLPRTGDVIVCMLGIMKAGGCYIPVDPEYPQERIMHVLSDSKAGFLITTEENAGSYENAMTLKELSENTKNPELTVLPEQLCYMIYTSGSTGKPKGVMITHGNIINYVTDTLQNTHVRQLVGNDCTFCSVTTVSFDMFLKEAFTTLMNGLTLVLADDEASKNPDALAKLMVDTGATAFNATPSRMLGYLELPEFRQAISQCRVVMAGGEKYPAALYERLRRCTDAVLINTYGPTETTVSSNAKILDGGNITIGAPLWNVVEKVMDNTGNLLPPGIVGELYIGGAGVAPGYYDNLQKTKEAFVMIDGISYYKSGDLASWTDSGEIVISGRNDGQIKLRGLRIELGEIENAAADLDGIKACVAAVRTIRGQEHLCAYYTADRFLPAESVRDHLAKSLTKYMVPTAYLQLERLPVTPNGKIDMKALPQAQLFQSADYEEPANDRERDFCEIISGILELERVGATDSFFDLGGNSLLVTQLTIDAAQKGYKISYADVFANPTPRALASIGEGIIPEKNKQDEYDYTQIDRLLSENTVDSWRRGEHRPVGNVFLTGATGFLGIHVLKHFLDEEKGCAYCLIRGDKGVERLKGVLFYYFSQSFDELFGSRIVVIPGDVTDPDAYSKVDVYPIDTMINCAANVKHFSAGTDIWDINVKGCENGIAFAKRKGCRFIQISTTSVAGVNVDHAVPDNTVLDERHLYFGQDISNQYVGSKFEAERAVLKACCEGLDGKIMRVGNLMARNSDGEFQMNFNTNSFLGKIKAYAIIGKIQYSQLTQPVEFAPVDVTARAILLLASAPAECRVFHPYNDHFVFMGDVISRLRALGINCEYCEEDEYRNAYSQALMDPQKAKELRALIAYENMTHGQSIKMITTINEYTSRILMRYNFNWPITTQEYLDSFMGLMKDLGVFD